jgi:hypothetical protein
MMMSVDNEVLYIGRTIVDDLENKAISINRNKRMLSIEYDDRHGNKFSYLHKDDWTGLSLLSLSLPMKEVRPLVSPLLNMTKEWMNN